MGARARGSRPVAPAASESARTYFRRPDVVSEYASFDFLLPPERTILEELAPGLAGARMLDVGVGAGRTTVHFAPLVREYVGIDISPDMIEACNRRFAGTSWNATFAVADARDLGRFEPASFDFVLFSFNGIDTVGGRDDRRAALREIHRVCRHQARFCFSSSNLRFALFRSSTRAWLWNFLRSEPAAALRHPGRLRTVAADSRRWRQLNPNLRELAAAGEGEVMEERPRYEFSAEYYASPAERIRSSKYYIDPGRQADQLVASGFRDVRIFGPDGRRMTGPPSRTGPPGWWIYYLCVRAD
jgi:ubiquinone/menaquinone biosynthesis C-methylase UbiE